MAAIRDARGLDFSAKAMLCIIESRGEAFTSADRLRDDCGMGRNKFYDVRRRLIDAGLIDVTVRRPRTTTLYRVNHEAVAALVPSKEQPTAPPVETLEANVNVPALGTPTSPPVVTPISPPLGTPSSPPVETQSKPSKRVFKRTIEKDDVSKASNLIRAGEIPWSEPKEWTKDDCAPLNAWDRAALTA
jgi:hypothetical protein